MTTVVQTTYRPQQRAGLVGMPADGTMASDDTRIVETSTGIGFGLAVSQGTGANGCVLGGGNFVGISMIDVSLVRSPIDPLSSVLANVDTYPQYSNCAIRSRGHIWVLAQANVNPGDALFYNPTNGGFCSAAGGEAAYGSLVFSAQPVDGNTLVIDGTTVTFKASGATGAQSNIGATLGDTITNLAAVLNGSADVNLVLMSYRAEPPSPGGAGQGSGANTLLIASKALGVAGNAYTLNAGTTPGVTLSGATLSGGVASGTAVPSGYWLSAAIAGQLAKVSLAIQR